MYAICRHIKTDGHQCGSPALKDTLFCFHHTRIKKLTHRRRNPNDFTYLVPFVFPEDRAAIQTNHFLVMQALNEGRIDQRTANSYTSMLRACRINLGKTPLLDSNHDTAVRRVILTPEGEEIAPPREQLEEGEAEPLHHKDCPCQRCAEEFRNAAPEQHHQNCQCGLCEPASAGESEKGKGESEEGIGESEKGKGESEKGQGESEKGKGESETTTTASANTEALSPLPFPLSPVSPPLSPAPRLAPAHNLYSKQLTIDPANKEVSLYDYLYGDKHKQYEAQYAARARAALEAGIEPPPYEPFDPKKIESEGMRRYKATMEQVEKNKQIAKEIWQRRFGDEDPQLPKSTELNP